MSPLTPSGISVVDTIQIGNKAQVDTLLLEVGE
jgi:hypothetical protein